MLPTDDSSTAPYQYNSHLDNASEAVAAMALLHFGHI